MYVPKSRALKYKEQKVTWLEGEADKSVIEVGDFNTLLSLTQRSTRPKVGMNTEDINHAIN